MEREWAGRDFGFGKGNFRYVLGRPNKDIDKDTGERIVHKDYPGSQLYDPVEKYPINDPLVLDSISRIFKSLSTRRERGDLPVVIASADASRTYLEKSEKKGIAFIERGDVDRLARTLDMMKLFRAIPAITIISERDGDDHSIHVVTITEYDPRTRTLKVNDQQGGPRNKQMSLADFEKKLLRAEDFRIWILPPSKCEFGLRLADGRMLKLPKSK